jgi:2-iminobutanoate/2-iminopropanoate deaminase
LAVRHAAILRIFFLTGNCSDRIGGFFVKKHQMGERKNFDTGKAPRMSQAFPQAVIGGGFIFVSGTPGYDLQTVKVVSENFEEQVRQSFQNIRTILEEAGSSMANVVKTTIFMVAGNDFSVINKVYGEFWPENAPARSTPQVNPFPAGILVSVECIALAK